MPFDVVEQSVLQVFKKPIEVLGGLADHYYLSETKGLSNSLGWGSEGLLLKGTVRITEEELARVEKFMSVAPYNMEIHNCEHFANYVLYGINLSSQQNLWWKELGASLVSQLQPVQRASQNRSRFIEQQISDIFKENLRQAKIERARQQRIEFWRERGVKVL